MPKIDRAITQAALVIAIIFGSYVIVQAATQISGQLPRDSSSMLVQAPTLIQFQDAAGTPVISPKTSLGTTPQLFTVPAGAVTFIFQCSAAGRYGDNSTLDGSGTGKGYKVANASTDCRVGCAGMTSIWVRAESGTITCDFMFEVIQ